MLFFNVKLIMNNLVTVSCSLISTFPCMHYYMQYSYWERFAENFYESKLQTLFLTKHL